MEDESYHLILNSIIKRFIRLVGAPAALNVARRVPRLAIDDKGNVLDYDRTDPLATITLLIDHYETIFGNIAATLAEQAAQPHHASPPATAIKRESFHPATTARRITILIVDDHVLFREGLASLLAAQPDFKVVGQTGAIQDGIRLAREAKPNVALLGFGVTDGVSADATRALLDESPQTQIVYLGSRQDQDRLFEAIRAGAVGFLFKNVRSAELINTVRGVMRGEAGISRTIARRLLTEFSRLPVPRLDEPLNGSKQPTAREVEIIRELARGASNREIAQRFVISENTVKNHVRNVLVKLHLRSRREIGTYVRRNGIPLMTSVSSPEFPK